MIDKPFESFTTFIHDLPGSFSAYRYEAFRSYKDGDKEKSILEDYFST